MPAKIAILIMEDEPMIALGLALAVEDIGSEVIGPVASVAEALTIIDRGRIGAAVIDAILIDRDVTPVALQLIDRTIPFVVYTGTGLPTELAAAFPDAPLVMKPTSPAQVLSTLLLEVGRSPAARR